MPTPSEVVQEKITAIKGVMMRATNEIGSMAVTHYKQNFQLGGFMDDTLKPWKKRKKETSKTRGRALLVKRAILKNSIRVFTKTQETIVIGSSVAYAKIHNEGGTIIQYPRSERFVRNRSATGAYRKGTTAGRGHSYGKRTIQIPKRQFIGDSGMLRKKIGTWYLSNLKTAGVIK